jgi:16S rRNA (cytosine1402-N4)-methyltransferase
MALRMAVNQEIRNLNALLESAPKVLRLGGRFGVISFHSNEDKPVKLNFRRRKAEGIYRILTKKPLVADDDERRRNPRSRSAKFRVVVRE